MTIERSAPVRLDHSAVFRAIVAAAWGSLAGRNDGIRRTPVRASAPAAPSLPGDGAAGSTVRLDAPPSPGVHPRVEADTVGPRAMRADTALPRAAARQGGPQLTAATGEDPDRPVAAVHHLAGAR